MKIIVIGAGTMGLGIAQCFATCHHQVYVIEPNETQRSKALQQISQSLEKFVHKKIITEEQAMYALNNLNFSTPLEQLTKEKIELVIEAVYEDLTIKKQLFTKLDHLFGVDTILASNTSSISISQIASNIKHPERVIGMHFMNPVPIMKLVEIITIEQTSADTLQKIVSLTEKLAKTPCVVKDYPGFIANRVLMPFINEAFLALEQKISTVETIDNISKLGFGHPMGPFQLADFIGLDICKNILEVLAKDFKNDKYQPAKILVQLVQKGFLGKKTSKGVYDYTTSKAEINKEIENLLC